MRELIKLARTEEGTIESVVKNFNGIAFAKVKIDNFHAVDFPSDALPMFQTVSSDPINSNSESRKIPKKGARVLVILKNPENPDEGGYIIGYLHNPMDQLIKKDVTVNVSEGSIITKTESNSGMIIENEKKDAAVFAGNSYVKVNNNKSELKNGASGIEINKETINISNDGMSAALILDKKESIISNEGNISIVTSKGSIIQKSLSNDIKTFGKMTRDASLIDEKSQIRTVTSGYIKMMGLNGKAFGGDNTIEIASLLGDIMLSATSGDMIIQSLNPLNYIEIFNGPLPSAKISKFRLENTLIELKTISPLGKININNGFGDIDIKADLSKILIEALQEVKLKSNLNIKFEGLMSLKGTSSLQIEFESDINASFNGKVKTVLGSDSTAVTEIKGTLIKIGANPIGNILTTATSPVVDNITGMPHIGVPFILAG